MMMHRYFSMKYLSALTFGLVATLLLAPDAAAVEPQDSGPVTAAEIRPEGPFFEIRRNGTVAALGREQCVQLFEDNIPIGLYASYQTAQAPSVYVFAAPTDESIQDFECDSDGQNNCTNISNIQAFSRVDSSLGFSFEQEIDFANLVEEAVEDVDEINGIELLQNVNDCTEKNIDQEYFLRFVFTPDNSQNEQLFDLVVHVDIEGPSPPEAVSSVSVTESSLFLSWQQEDTEDLVIDPDDEVAGERNLAPFVVFYSARDITGASLETLKSADDVQSSAITRDDPTSEGPDFSGEAPLEDVDVDTSSRIWVAIAARDDVGNLSEPVYPDGSEDGFEVVPVIDFWENYKGAGGRETGCNIANGNVANGNVANGHIADGHSDGGAPIGGAGLLFAVAGLGWLGWRRRRRLRRLLPLAAGVIAFGATAGVSHDASADSPTWGISEIRLGGYYPAIDDEAGLTGKPFEEIFGSSTRVLVEYEQGLHLFDGFGALGASATVGYTHFGGDVLFEADVELDTEALDEKSGFMVVPFRAGLYYRVDQFEKYWNIPLVPVAKAGLDYVLWQAEAPNGDAATAGGDRGEGTTAGWHVSAALHLQLDWIEPTSAASFDYTWGINNTYAFAEYMYTQVDDFGSSDSFILSDSLWMFGLAFEY
jgi:hypothetical protein